MLPTPQSRLAAQLLTVWAVVRVASGLDAALASTPLLFVGFCAVHRSPVLCDPFIANFEQAYGVVLSTFPENTRPELRLVRAS